ncbi:MAG: type II secretion system protein GspE, partial [Candidatus Omnitrophica bacterium]|nr:type II secretion system protein GspE [Candidatus Omnitrophota bacterium]
MGVLKKRLTDILTEGKHITQEQLERALEIQKNTGLELRNILIKEGFITEHELLAVLSRELFIPYLDLSRYKVDPQIASLIPEKVSKQYKVMAVSLIGNTLTVAMFDPLNIFVIDDLKVFTGYEIDPVIASEKEIVKIVDNIYKKGNFAQEMSGVAGSQHKDSQAAKEEEYIDIGSSVEDSQKAPIVKIVDLLITEALKKRASDLHLEPEERDLRVRYRIDGHLHDMFRLPKKNQNAVLA